jgi:hypothetical protein
VDEGGGALEKVLALARHQLGQVLALCRAQPWQLAVPTTREKNVSITEENSVKIHAY